MTGLGGLYLEGLIHRRAYFRNFTVLLNRFYLNGHPIGYDLQSQKR